MTPVHLPAQRLDADRLSITQVDGNTTSEPLACSPSERERYRPPNGPTLDRLLRIDEDRLLAAGFESLVNHSFFDGPPE